MVIVFWLSVAFVLYAYVGYPALLAVWARARNGVRRQVSGLGSQRSESADRGSRFTIPGVSVIVAARNEARRLPERIDNLLASDYPPDRVQIIVASDGSTDDTAAALAPYRDRVTLLLLPARGKAAALNAAVLHARHPILVFADARQRFAPDAIRRLVAAFSQPGVGAVSGELVIDCEEDEHAAEQSTIGDGVGAYWKYEKWIRRNEAIVGSSIGVTGAIYAMRRWLWQPLPTDAILDDVLGPMRIVQRGYRVRFEPRARAFDRTASDAAAELRRKTRTLAGNFQLLRYEPFLIVPGRNPVWLQFVSHKLARLVVPYALMVLLVSSAWLTSTSPVYTLAFAGQVMFYGLALYGALLDRRARVTPAPAAEVFREAA
jgi:cellulose synthase/poly-beta-1,6-N-acetylglucosamine synthase-like glycosyltransferase